MINDKLKLTYPSERFFYFTVHMYLVLRVRYMCARETRDSLVDPFSPQKNFPRPFFFYTWPKYKMPFTSQGQLGKYMTSYH